jgi:hypothetical protein
MTLTNAAAHFGDQRQHGLGVGLKQEGASKRKIFNIFFENYHNGIGEARHQLEEEGDAVALEAGQLDVNVLVVGVLGQQQLLQLGEHVPHAVGVVGEHGEKLAKSEMNFYSEESRTNV